MLNPLLLLPGFVFLGAGIKYIDCVFDENVFNKNAAYVLALICGIVMGTIIALDEFAAVILISITIGVAIGRKIDNIAFIVGAILVLSVPFFINNFTGILVFPIAILVTAEIIDDFGNNLADAKRLPYKFLELFFHYRLTLELVTGLLVLLGMIPVLYWLALILFDLSYHAVGGYADRVKLSQVRIKMGDDADESWVRLDRKHSA